MVGQDRESKAPDAGGSESRAAWARLEIVGDGCQSDEPRAGGPSLSVRVGAASIDVRPGFDSKLLADVLRVALIVSGDECLVVSGSEGLSTC